MDNEVIKFTRSKDYIFKKDLEQGGTGRTVLIYDQIINEYFVCKKYSTYYKEDQEKYFSRFIDEIKILYKLNHKNIVRVFSYHLYPDRNTGFIIMERIKGNDIVEYIDDNPDKIDDIFKQVIEAFLHLEKKGILHRDIRPSNILVSDDNKVKVIDFGFSKIIESQPLEDKSVSLNWRYNLPKEFNIGKYDNTTEVYFIGKMFEEILQNHNSLPFAHKDLITNMIVSNPKDRVKSFEEVHRILIGEDDNWLNFSEIQKSTYRLFADQLENIISEFEYEVEYDSDIEKILNELKSLIQNSILEKEIQNPSAIVGPFLKNNSRYKYDPKKKPKLAIVENFYNMMKNIDSTKQRAVIYNLWNRFDNIERYDQDIDLPF